MDNGRIAVLGLAAALGVGTSAAVLEYRSESTGAEFVQLTDDDVQSTMREDDEGTVLVAEEDDLGEGDVDVANTNANETTNAAGGTGGATTGGQAGDTTQAGGGGFLGGGGGGTDDAAAAGGGAPAAGGTEDGGGGGDT
jgi:hypothetical protein